ncbi:MAG: tetratricopeptide repeat protein [bacterium]
MTDRRPIHALLAPMIASCALALATAGAAWAAEASENLVSRGLIQFHRADYAAARQSFEAAVSADPVNVEARHFRAMTAARLGDLDDAIFDLEVVLLLKPAFCEAALQLGIAYLQLGDDAAAIGALERARQCPALDPDASLLIGIARLHRDDLDEAADALQRAGQKDALRVTADYYLGVAGARRWQWDAAAGRFESVRAARPDAEIGLQSDAYLRQLRRYHLSAAVGIDYDSNVVLAPSNDSVKADVGITNQADGRVAFVVGARAAALRSEHLQLVLDYDFYQTVQFQLHQYDLTANQPGAQLLFNAGSVYGGVMGRYGYYLLDGASFLQDAEAAPWMAVPENDLGRTEVYYRMLWQDFYLSPFRGVRDSVNNAIGVRQFVYLPRADRYLVVGYRFENQDATQADGDAFAYNANQVEIGLGWDLTSTLNATLGYAYRNEDYASASDGRVDNTNHVTVAIRQGLRDWCSISLVYLGTFNDSNQSVFTYDRNIISASFEARY